MSYFVYDLVDMVETNTLTKTYLAHHICALWLEAFYMLEYFPVPTEVIKWFLCIETSNSFINLWLKTRSEYIYVPFAITFVPLRTIGMYLTLPVTNSILQKSLVYFLWIMSCVHAYKIIRKCPKAFRDNRGFPMLTYIAKLYHTLYVFKEYPLWATIDVAHIIASLCFNMSSFHPTFEWFDMLAIHVKIMSYGILYSTNPIIMLMDMLILLFITKIPHKTICENKFEIAGLYTLTYIVNSYYFVINHQWMSIIPSFIGGLLWFFDIPRWYYFNSLGFMHLCVWFGDYHLLKVI